MLRGLKLLVVAILMVGMASGCVRTRTAEVAPGEIEILGSVAPACPDERALALVLDTAAIETLRRGYDKFQFLDSRGTVVRRTVYSYSNFYHQRTTYESKGHKATVRMFREGDGSQGETVDARAHLGEDWETHVSLGPDNTCL